MKKRLRKKLHVAEFRQYGVNIHISITSAKDFDSFLWNFIDYAIEANKCYFGGGGVGKSISGVIDMGREKDRPISKLTAIRSWLDNQTNIESYSISELKDICYDNFD